MVNGFKQIQNSLSSRATCHTPPLTAIISFLANRIPVAKPKEVDKAIKGFCLGYHSTISAHVCYTMPLYMQGACMTSIWRSLCCTDISQSHVISSATCNDFLNSYRKQHTMLYLIWKHINSLNATSILLQSLALVAIKSYIFAARSNPLSTG